MYKKLIFKKTILTLFLLFSCSNTNIYASSNLSVDNNPEINTLGGSGMDSLRKIIQTKDKGFLVVGHSTSVDYFFDNNGSSDAIIIKYDKSGNQQWAKNFGGSNSDSFSDVAEMDDGSIIAVGYSHSADAGFDHKGGNDGIIVKYNRNGNQQWVKSFGGSDWDKFIGVTKTSDGKFVAVGESESQDAGFENPYLHSSHAIIAKYDLEGNRDWFKANLEAGIFVSVLESSNKDLILVSNDDDGGYSGLYKYNKDGDLVWGEPIVEYGAIDLEDVVEVDGGFITIGTFNALMTGSLAMPGFIVKYNNDGSIEWSKHVGLSPMEAYSSIIKTSDKGFLMVGTSVNLDEFVSEGALIKYDKNFAQEWTKTISIAGAENIGFSSVIETSGDFIAVGSVTTLRPDDILLTKINKDKTIEEVAVDNALATLDLNDISDARNLVNQMDESIEKDRLHDMLNSIFPNVASVSKETVSANADIYIVPKNTLSLSLDTNSVTFDDISATEDTEKKSAINITVSSSLPYDLNAYMPSRISNSDGSSVMDMDVLNIKESSENDYKIFANTTDKIILKGNNQGGSDVNHSIDLKLHMNKNYKTDVYRAVIKFEAEQK
ncbi:MAG: hypothetical protein J6F30_07415 [Cellulosilyticum sp.]|nr:hypothetical protein [Cellulosilyticum sp.]